MEEETSTVVSYVYRKEVGMGGTSTVVSYLQRRGGVEGTIAQWYLTYSEEVGRKGAHNLVLILSHNIQPIDIKHPENKIKLFFNDFTKY